VTFNFNRTIRAVSRVALVKPEKARGVEDLIISAAQRGQVSTVDEPQLISLLEQIKDKEQKEQTKVTVSTLDCYKR
jgi:programmed cell death protein 5